MTTHPTPAPQGGWLTDAEQRTWRSVLFGNRLLVRRLDDDLQQHGLSLGEYEILAMLSEAPATGMRMSGLAELVVQSRSRLSHTAARLEQRGLVARTQTLGDRRGVDLRLTDSGLALLREVAPEHVASVRTHLLGALTAAERAELGRLMGIVRASLTEET